MLPSVFFLRFTISILLIFALIDRAKAVECYECNSHVDSRCADDVPPDSMKKSCQDLVDGSKYTFCRKIDQQVEFEVNGLPKDKRIIRSCGWNELKYANECYQRSGFGGAQTVCSCYGNYCNGANYEASASLYFTLLSFLFISIMKKITGL